VGPDIQRARPPLPRLIAHLPHFKSSWPCELDPSRAHKILFDKLPKPYCHDFTNAWQKGTAQAAAGHPPEPLEVRNPIKTKLSWRDRLH
jgi:hypothetical protein